MFARLNVVADYVCASKAALGEDSAAVTSLQNTQVDHLKTVFATGRMDLDDAAAVLQSLAADGKGSVAKAFTSEQRRTLAEAVANASGGNTQQPMVASGKSKLQTHYHFHQYLTESDWKVLMTTSDNNSKLSTLVKRAHKVGLTHPSELTVVAIVAIVTSTARTNIAAEEAHSLVLEYKRLNKAKRAAGAGLAQTMQTFPRSVDEFVAAHPAAFSDGEAPVQCPFDEEDVERARNNLAARKSHRSLSGTSGTRSSCSSPSSQSPASLVTALASAIMSQYNRQTRDPEPVLVFNKHKPPQPLLPCAPSSPATSFPALTDGKPLVASPPEAHGAAALEHGDDDMPDPPTSRKVTKKALDDIINDVCGALDHKKGRAEGSTKSETLMLKRPAAAAGASTARRPSLTVLSSRSSVVCRTGQPGPGNSKTFTFNKGEEAAAKKKGEAWLREKCAELGVEP